MMLKNWNRTSHLIGVLPAVTLLIVVALTACAPRSVDQSAELAAETDRWGTALNSGDVEGLVSVYSGDCLLMAPNAEMQKGRDAVRAVFGGMIEAGLGGKLDTISVTASGDIGHHMGTYELVAPNGSVVDRGKFTEIWKKVNDQWQMAADIWNSDLPEGAGKTLLHISHEVEDADVWLDAWIGSGNRKEIFAQNGAPNVRVFQSPENANHVGLVAEISDMDAFMAWMSSPEAQTAKTEDGVIDSTLRFMTEVK
jgi:ketosteroid isomerase-like protein